MYSFKYIPTITSTFFEMSMLLTMVYKGNAKATIFCLKQQQIQPKNDSQFIRKPESLTVLWSGCSKANQLKSEFYRIQRQSLLNTRLSLSVLILG